jgi:hypothetical protein
MTDWMRGAATNPVSACVCVMSLGAAALVLLYAIQTVRESLRRLSEQAASMVPHHVGVFSESRPISPSLFVIELGRTLVVGYATDIKDADHVCKMSWLRNGLKSLIIDDNQVWKGKTEIAAREAAASERIRFMNAMGNSDGILLDRIEADDQLNFVMVDRDRRRLVKIGYA